MQCKRDNDFGVSFANQKGGALVAVLSIAIIINIALVALYFSINSTTKKSGGRKTKATALNIAEAGKENLYADIRAGRFVPLANTSVQRYTNHPFNSGTFTVSCSSNANVDTMWVRSVGVRLTSTTTIATVAKLTNAMTIPFPPVRGAITARSGLVIKGNINIDGRDHDSNGVIIGLGLWGVSTCGALAIDAIDGASTIAGMGLPPVDKHGTAAEMAQVSEANAPVTPIFDSPEAFLGLPPGSLDQYKVPTVSPPFNALVYVDADYLGPIDFGESRGILIVHNAAKTAELKINNGTFKGIIITDRMDKIAGTAQIIGSVVTITDSEVSTFGTGTADIKYSAQVLANLAKYCTNLKKATSEVSWREVDQ